jgi:hypothetical protein
VEKGAPGNGREFSSRRTKARGRTLSVDAWCDCTAWVSSPAYNLWL